MRFVCLSAFTHTPEISNVEPLSSHGGSLCVSGRPSTGVCNFLDTQLFCCMSSFGGEMVVTICLQEQHTYSEIVQ